MFTGVYQAEARQMIRDGVVEEFWWRNSTYDGRSAVMNNLASRLAESRWVARMVSGSVEKRILNYLTHLAHSDLGKHVGDSIEVFLPRHEDVALVVGTTRETASWAIAKLKKSGLISCKNRRTLVVPVVKTS